MCSGLTLNLPKQTQARVNKVDEKDITFSQLNIYKNQHIYITPYIYIYASWHKGTRAMTLEYMLCQNTRIRQNEKFNEILTDFNTP